jgi:diaminopimelate epimerase
MQGAGNDFILFDNRTLKLTDAQLTEHFTDNLQQEIRSGK